MASLFAAVIVGSLASVGFGFNAKGYDFIFRSNPYAPRALYVPPNGNPMDSFGKNALSICFDVLFENYKSMHLESLFSYSNPESYNYFMLELRHKSGDIRLYVDSSAEYLKLMPQREKWIHFCISWASDNGVVQVYFDGERKFKTSGIRAGKTLNSQKGYLNLGQDQDGYDSGWDPKDGLRARMTRFNVWDKELTQEEVTSAHNCSLEGSLVAWSKAQWLLSGHIDAEPSTSPCSRTNNGDTIGLSPTSGSSKCKCPQ